MKRDHYMHDDSIIAMKRDHYVYDDSTPSL